MEIEKIVDSLSPNEKKVVPHLEEGVTEICKKTNLEKTSVVRALEYLKNKGAVELSYNKKKIIELDVNGALYLKKGFPERRLLNLLEEKREISLDDAKKESRLSDDEFKAAIGTLKKKGLINMENKNIILEATNSEIAQKTDEERLLEELPCDYESLEEDLKKLVKPLQKRKNIIETREETEIGIEVTDLGKQLMDQKLDDKEMIEQVTPDLIKNSGWKGKKFRRYDVTSSVPSTWGGKRHFVNQAADYARKVWTEMGFKEMSGNMVESSFWNFDALFTPQDHPARELQDTFFVDAKNNSELPKDDLVKEVKSAHEHGCGKKSKSKGWQYDWSEEKAKQPVLRTHTTSLSAKKLTELKNSDLPAKFFAIGKCFRNETLDWSHSFEFNQTEGIVVDKNANFRHLLGYLKQFFRKMGFDNVKFRPFYFPYTEPSVEIDAWHPEREEWVELGGAGILRPEVVIPLIGEYVPVLAWGPGLDRILMDYYKIQDIRDLYKNDISQLRKTKWFLRS
ncbi:MAG: phenylalanine--tRNA ligase subunit alpha [Candidatus Pacearchaeota archaeon]